MPSVLEHSGRQMTGFEWLLHADTGERMVFCERVEKQKAWPVMTCKNQLLGIPVLSVMTASFRAIFSWY